MNLIVGHRYRVRVRRVKGKDWEYEVTGIITRTRRGCYVFRTDHGTEADVSPNRILEAEELETMSRVSNGHVIERSAS